MLPDQDSSLKVRVRDANLWFFLAFLLFAFAAIVFILRPGKTDWQFSAVLAALGTIPFLWAILGAKRSIEFGDHLMVHGLTRIRVVRWSEITFVSFEEMRSKLPVCGFPVPLPWTQHVMTLRLCDGGTICATINPANIEAISTIVRQRADLDYNREKRRIAGELISEVRFDKLFYTFFAVGLAVIGFGLTIAMTNEVLNGTRSHNWPQADGRVQRAVVTSEQKEDRYGKHFLYTPSITYTYEVDAAEYTGNRYRFSPSKFVDESIVAKIVDVHRPGSDVKVRYMLGDPSVSVLIPGIPEDRYIVFGGSIIFGVGALIFAVVNLRRYLVARKIPVPRE